VIDAIAVGRVPPHHVEMSEKAQRRRFTAAYKLQVLQDAGRCTKPGELGALLRREGLYSSHLAAWRTAQRRGALAGPARRRGPPRRAPHPPAARVAQLERQLAAAVKRAERAEAIVEIQKKVAALLGRPLEPTEPS
jgi:transposase-like protein